MPHFLVIFVLANTFFFPSYTPLSSAPWILGHHSIPFRLSGKCAHENRRSNPIQNSSQSVISSRDAPLELGTPVARNQLPHSLNIAVGRFAFVRLLGTHDVQGGAALRLVCLLEQHSAITINAIGLSLCNSAHSRTEILIHEFREKREDKRSD